MKLLDVDFSQDTATLSLAEEDLRLLADVAASSVSCHGATELAVRGIEQTEGERIADVLRGALADLRDPFEVALKISWSDLYALCTITISVADAFGDTDLPDKGVRQASVEAVTDELVRLLADAVPPAPASHARRA